MVLVPGRIYLNGAPVKYCRSPVRRSVYMTVYSGLYVSQGSEERYTYNLNSFSDFTPSLLSVNRQIRLETIPIFFEENRFDLKSHGAIVPFLSDQSALALASLRHVQFDIDLSTPRSKGKSALEVALDFMADILQLKSLMLFLWVTKVIEYLTLPSDLDSSSDSDSSFAQMPWIHSLIKSKGLVYMFVRVRYRGWDGCDPSRELTIVETMNRHEARIRTYLESKMMIFGVDQANQLRSVPFPPELEPW